MEWVVAFSSKGFGTSVRGIKVSVNSNENTLENSKIAESLALDVASQVWGPDVEATVDYVIPIYHSQDTPDWQTCSGCGADVQYSGLISYVDREGHVGCSNGKRHFVYEG
jgi:hypothetical protein